MFPVSAAQISEFWISRIEKKSSSQGDQGSRNTGMGSGNTHNSKDTSSDGGDDSADNIGVRNNHDGGPRNDRSFCRVTRLQPRSEEGLDKPQ